MLHYTHIAKNERKQFVRTLTLALFFKAGSAGFVVSLTMQCSQDLTPFAGKTLHDILFTIYPKNSGNLGQSINGKTILA